MSELLLPDSNLVAFNIRPAGQAWQNSPFAGVSGGINTLQMFALGASGTTSVTVQYRQQYLDVGG